MNIRQTQAVLFLALLFGLVFGQVQAAGTLSERNYKKLQEIHQHINAKQYQQAQTKIDAVLTKKTDSYTQALFLQTSAHVAITRERYAKAIKLLAQALSMKALPTFVETNITYNLTQLTVEQGDDTKALKYMKQWLKRNNKPTAEHHIFAATVYAQKKHYKSAVKHVKKAIAQVKKPQESWYQMLVSYYLEQKRYQEAIPIYHQLIKRYPKKLLYWKQVSGLYLQVKQKQQALAVLHLAYRQGMLKKTSDLMRLVDLFLYVNNPYQAGELLHKEMQAKRLKPSAKHWRKLADCWVMAQEYEKSIEALRQASKMDSKHGAIDVRIGRLLMAQGKWNAAYQAIAQGLRKGVKDVGETQLQQGICAYYADRPKQAGRAFRDAMQNKKVKKRAQAWLQQLE